MLAKIGAQRHSQRLFVPIYLLVRIRCRLRDTYSYLLYALYNAHFNAHNKTTYYEVMTMQELYDFSAPKKATNLSLNSDLLKKTKELNINLSATLEQALKDKLKTIEAKKWLKQNKNAIQAYNNFVEENGCFSDEYREF